MASNLISTRVSILTIPIRTALSCSRCGVSYTGKKAYRPSSGGLIYFLPSVADLVGEPNVLIVPYAPGWSTLADGVNYPGLDGLRGIIATDLFHHASTVFQYRRPGDFQIKAGDPPMRLLPVPRHLLDAPREKPLSGGPRRFSVAPRPSQNTGSRLAPRSPRPMLPDHFVRVPRFLQFSAAMTCQDSSYRMIPIAFLHTPTSQKPSRKAQRGGTNDGARCSFVLIEISGAAARD